MPPMPDGPCRGSDRRRYEKYSEPNMLKMVAKTGSSIYVSKPVARTFVDEPIISFVVCLVIDNCDSALNLKSK